MRTVEKIVQESGSHLAVVIRTQHTLSQFHPHAVQAIWFFGSSVISASYPTLPEKFPPPRSCTDCENYPDTRPAPPSRSGPPPLLRPKSAGCCEWPPQ